VKLAKAYRRFTANARPAVLETLISRPAFAKALLDNVGETRIPRSDITAFHARQIRSFADADLARKLAEVWGEVHESGADKMKVIAELKTKLTADVLARADLSQGRALAQVCTTCHTLYGEGGKVGPDLTGSGRADLGYLLENIVDPSGVVTPEYRMSVLTLKDGRVLTGVVAAQTERALTLRSITDSQTIERGEIAKQENLPASMMPEGMLQALDETQRRDLIAYLMHPTQVALPAAAGK
jgi:putative heme-binding domain-containing protein